MAYKVIKIEGPDLRKPVGQEFMTRKSARHFCKNFMARMGEGVKAVIAHPDGTEEIFEQG
ncbi:hypothetical protein SAMN05216302_101136 [Nitrosomonas aestuarii]|uniref:Uncharacterized protein n=1 Tax=Nitrosomonas aestuarii TaxID=52441 RepID=A0A1I4B7G3_9PROT|nr:hypothetical protein SAMN05216302_101136 [Nitrosomonas aestuarii]